MPYSRPYASGFVDYPTTTTPINSTALNTMDVGIKTANDQFQTVTTAQRALLTPTVGQCVWDSDLRQLMVYMNASGGNAWQPIGNAIVCTSTTRPATPFEGQVIRETDTNKEFTYSGAAWVQTNTWGTTSGVTGVSNLIVPPACKVIRTTNLTGYSSATAITWSSAAYDTDGMFAAGSPTVITVQTPGLYVVTLNASLVATATVTRIAAGILKNGAVVAYQDSFGTSTGGYSSMSATISGVASDTIGAWISVTGGSAYIVGGNSSETQDQSRLTATWIGRTS